GVGYGAACPRQLNDGGADAAGGAGNEHTFVFDHVGAVEHVLAGHVGAAEGGQLGVADVGIGLVGVGGGHHNVFGVAAVATVADVVDVRQAVVAFGAVVYGKIDHDALADARTGHARPHRLDGADGVGALDAGKGKCGFTALPGGLGV